MILTEAERLACQGFHVSWLGKDYDGSTGARQFIRDIACWVGGGGDYTPLPRFAKEVSVDAFDVKQAALASFWTWTQTAWEYLSWYESQPRQYCPCRCDMPREIA